MGLLTERLAILVDAKTDVAARGFRDLSRDADKLGASTDKTTGLLGRLGERAGVSGSAIKGALGVAAVAGVGLLTTAVTASIRTFLDLAGAVDDFQDASGASAEDASKLVNVVKQLGVEPDVAAKAMFKLGKEVADNSAALRQYGIETARNVDGTTDLVGTLANVSAAYRSTNDGATKNAIATAAFGKAGIGLVDVLSLTDRQLEALSHHGPIFTQKDIDGAKQAEINLRAARLELENVQVEATKQSVGFFGPIQHAADEFGEFIGLLPKGFADAQRELDKGAAAADIEAESVAGLDDATRSLRVGLLGAQDAQTALTRAEQAEQSAVQSVAEKRDALNRLLRAGAVDTKAVEAAQRSLETAQRQLGDTQDRLVAAQTRLNTLQAGPSADTLAEANLNLRDATLGVADAEAHLADERSRLAALESGQVDPVAVGQAQQKVAKAQDNLDKVRKGSFSTAGDLRDAEFALSEATRELADAQSAGVPTAAQLTEAKRRVESASIGLERAQRDQKAAQQAVTDLDPSSAATARDVEAAKKELGAAERDVADAQRAVLKAGGDLRDAQAGDPEFDKKVAAARRDVRDAEQGVADAKNHHLTAVYGLRDALGVEAGLLDGSRDAAARLHGELEEIARIYPQLAPLLQGLLAKTGVTAIGVTTGAGIRPSGGLDVRAAGGPVGAGESYLVGERGPEILRMGARSGFITPNSQIGGGKPIIINSYSLDPASAGPLIAAALRDAARSAGGLALLGIT